jgi:putative glutamine amidotransferase
LKIIATTCNFQSEDFLPVLVRLSMARPVVGIVGNHYLINDEYPSQATGEMNISAISKLVDAVALIVPSLPTNASLMELMSICDGFLFTGGRPNVHPMFYGVDETPAHGLFDINRDTLTLPLIRECVEAGKPILGICRGFQEFNVAFGGTLHPEIRDLPGRMNHRMPPDGTLEEKFALRHKIKFLKGGKFTLLLKNDEVEVNSLHGQGIDKPGERIILEGYATDGTPEALYVKDAKGFCFAVQWHVEWNAENDTTSKSIFNAFGNALRGKDF